MTIFWAGEFGSSWLNAADWALFEEPTIDDDVGISHGGVFFEPVLDNGTGDAHTLIVEDDSTLTIGTGGILQVASTITIGTNVDDQLIVNSGGEVSVENGGVINVGGTTLGASGDGTLVIGGSTAAVNWLGGGIIAEIALNSTGSEVFFNTTDNVVFDNFISGDGSVAQVGSGTVILTGDDTYAGGTTIVGMLQVGDDSNSGALGSGAVDIVAGALTFAQTFEFTEYSNVISGAGSVTFEDGADYDLLSTCTYTGGTTVASATELTLGNGATNGFVAGAIVDNGTVTFDLAGKFAIANAISGSGGVDEIGAEVFLTGANTYTHGTFISASTTLAIGNDGATGSIGAGNITDDGSLVFDRTGTLTVGDAISGTGGVTQIASGTTVLTGANTYSGPTTIAAGTLQIGNGGASGTLGTGNVLDNGSLVFERDNSLNVAIIISGTGGITQQLGATFLTGANTYSGRTTIDSGATLVVGNGGTAGTLGTGAVVDNGTLEFDRTDTMTVANNISGTGVVGQFAGTTILTGENSFTGEMHVVGGTLKLGLGAASALFGPPSLVVDAGATFDLAGNSETVTSIGGAGSIISSVAQFVVNLFLDTTDDPLFAGFMGGTGIGSVFDLTLQGSGTLTLTGDNECHEIDVANGALQVGDGGTTGNAGNDIVDDSTTVTFDRSDQGVSIFQLIEGGGGVNFIGGGGYVLTGQNSYNGATTIAAGASVQVGGGSTLGQLGLGEVDDNGSLTIDLSSTLAVTNNISGTGSFTQAGSGATVLSGDNTNFAGVTTIAAGTLSIKSDDEIGSGGLIIDGGATFALTAGFSNSFAITLDGAATIDDGNYDVFNGAITGSGSLTLTASGQNAEIALTHANGYSGGTNVDGGVLDTTDDGALGGGLLTLDDNAEWIIETGSVANAVEIDGSSTFAVFSNTARTLTGTIADGAGQGSLIVLGDNALVVDGANSYSGSTEIQSGATLKAGAAGVFDAKSSYAVDAGGALDLGGFDETIDGLSGAGTITDGAAGSSILTIDQPGASTFGGIINNGAGQVALVIAGGGGLTLTGADKASGGATIENATLEIGVGGSVAGAITFGAGFDLLQIDGAPTAAFANQLVGVSSGDVIDLSGLKFVQGATATYASATGKLTVTSGAVSETFTLLLPQETTFVANQDAKGGTSVSAAFTGVSTAAELNADIATIDKDSQAGSGNATSFIIELTKGATLTETADLEAINLKGSDTLTILGDDDLLSGASAHRGLFVYSGAVTVENLTLENMKAIGGAGAGGGGGGAGLGGGLFVADDTADGASAAGSATLIDVAFKTDSATGGKGGAFGAGGGGGGLGGAGGVGGGGVGGGAKGASSGLAGKGIVAGAGGNSGGGGGAGLGGGVGAPGVNGGFGGGGGFTGFIGGSGGFGGGGAAGGPSTGGDGGFGGFGGGGGAAGQSGGAGGGGFGAGGGGGFGGGGGGGLGAGGDIFVQAGATLKIEGGSMLTGGTANAGAAGSTDSGKGSGFGGGIFIEGGTAAAPAVATLGAGQTAGQTTSVGGVIADQNGSVAGSSGVGALVIAGAGTVALSAANTYTGGTTIDAGATLDLTGAGGIGAGGLTLDAGGFLDIASGAAPAIKGTSSLTGEVEGSGTFDQAAGSATVNVGATMIVANWTIASGAAATIAKNLSYAGILTAKGGSTITIDSGETLALSGTTSLAGSVAGAGTLAAVGGTTTLNTGVALSVTNLATRGTATTLAVAAQEVYAGTLNEAAGTTIGVAAGDKLQTTGAVTFNGTVSGAGALSTTGGTASFGATAAVSVAAWTISGATTTANISDQPLSYNGALTLQNGATIAIAAKDVLQLTKTATITGGTIAGAGTLDLSQATTTISGGAVTVANWRATGGTTTIAKNLAYGGAFTAEGGATLTLSGSGAALSLLGQATFASATINGAGALTTSAKTGSASMAGLTIGGTVVWTDGETVTQNGGNLTLGDSSNGAARLNLTTTGVYDITDDTGIALGGTGASSITNSGALEKTAGAGVSVIAAGITNSGLISATSGTLDLHGSIAGPGVDEVGGGATLQFDGSVAATQTVKFATSGGEVSLDDLHVAGVQLFHATLSGWAAGDSLDVGTTFGTGTTFNFVENSGNASGVLHLTDGTATAAIAFAGDFSNANFTPSVNASGATVLTFHA